MKRVFLKSSSLQQNVDVLPFELNQAEDYLITKSYWALIGTQPLACKRTTVSSVSRPTHQTVHGFPFN